MRKINYAAALATTASVALLSGMAHADTMAGAPDTCTTTQINPGHNDCVMPTAVAPGTNTSFALHGFFDFHFTRDIGPHEGDTNNGLGSGFAIEGPGATAAQLQAHAANGGIDITAKTTRPNIET